MPKSERFNMNLVIGAFLCFLGCAAIIVSLTNRHIHIDPDVEQACHDEIKQGAPLGHRSIMTHSYDEVSSNLGIAEGSLEAQYVQGKWTQVAWTCRVNPTNQDIARVELTATTGGQKLKAAASAFQ